MSGNKGRWGWENIKSRAQWLKGQEKKGAEKKEINIFWGPSEGHERGRRSGGGSVSQGMTQQLISGGVARGREGANGW